MDSHDNTARLGDSTVELPGPVVLRRIVPRQTALHELWRAPGSFARRYAILLGILLIAATADAITTLNNLLAYGIEVEAHPVQRWVSHMIGPHAGVPVAKVVQLMFVLLVAAVVRLDSGHMQPALRGCGREQLLPAVVGLGVTCEARS